MFERWPTWTTHAFSWTVLVAVALVRIVTSAKENSQTWDEPAHIAAGMEWLQYGTYTLDPMHPPLARILSAAGLFAEGLRLDGVSDEWRVTGDE